MRIAVIASSKIPSNTANSIQVMKVCQALTELGNEVCLWVPGSTQANWEQLTRYYGISTTFPIYWVKTRNFAKRYDFALESVLKARSWKPDCIYTWMVQTAALGGILGIPVLIEMHMLPSGVFGPKLFKFILEMNEKKRILSITNALITQLEQSYSVSIPNDIVRIAPMGFDAVQYRNLPEPDEARSKLGYQPDRLIAGYTGHLYPGRGMDILVGLAEAFPQVQFLWVGGREEDVKFWKQKVVQAGLVNITLTGFINNQQLPLYQAASDILLMPYARTVGVSSGGNTADVCSPMKMFDYLASGRAILTSDLPVLHEVLNEENAVFCSPDDIEAWKNSFGRLVQDGEYRKKLANRARRDSQKYTWRSRAEHSIQDFL